MMCSPGVEPALKAPGISGYNLPRHNRSRALCISTNEFVTPNRVMFVNRAAAAYHTSVIFADIA